MSISGLAQWTTNVSNRPQSRRIIKRKWRKWRKKKKSKSMPPIKKLNFRIFPFEWLRMEGPPWLLPDQLIDCYEQPFFSYIVIILFSILLLLSRTANNNPNYLKRSGPTRWVVPSQITNFKHRFNLLKLDIKFSIKLATLFIPRHTMLFWNIWRFIKQWFLIDIWTLKKWQLSHKNTVLTY